MHDDARRHPATGSPEPRLFSSAIARADLARAMARLDATDPSWADGLGIGERFDMVVVEAVRAAAEELVGGGD